MADVLVRDVDPDVLDRLTARARALGLPSRVELLRRLLIEEAERGDDPAP